MIFNFLDCVPAISVSFLLLTATSVRASSASLDSCLSTANLQPVTPSSFDYGADSLAYNRRLSYKPASIVFPSTVQEVANAIKCASQAGVKVAARSGGHSYAANGLGGQDGSLVVDLQHLNSIKVIASNQTAVFGAGIRLGDLALALYKGGKQAIPHGEFLVRTSESCRDVEIHSRSFLIRNLPVCGHRRTSRMRRFWFPIQIMGTCT